MTPNICIHRLAYLEEILKDVPIESYSGYINTGCDKCAGLNSGCESYFDGSRIR